MVGFSKLAGSDEERTLARLRALRSDLIDPTIAVHNGRIVKRTGDGVLIEFRSVVDAVRCAIEMQNGMIERNAGLPPERRIEFRVGIHLGDVVEESDGDLMGDSVNIAARLEGIADPGGICLSEDAYRQVRDRCVRSRCLIILQEPLDVVELLLRTQHVAEAAAQLLDDAACALDVDLARHLHRVVVAVFAPAQRTAKRIGVLLRARLAEPAAAAGTGTLSHLLLHRLRQTLRALAQGIERAPLRVDGAVGVALAETALRLAHGFSGAAEVVHIALALTLLARLTLLVLAETAVLELFEQFVEAVAQGLLALPQVAKRVALLALLALLSLMTLLPLSALRSALGAAPALILTLAEGAVAQIL